MLKGFFKKLIMARQLTLEDGRIEEFGVRMAFLPTYTITKLVEEMYADDPAAAFDHLFETGRAHGHYVFEEVGEAHDVPRNRFVQETVESANVLGLGEVTAEQVNTETGKIVLRVEDSPFAETFPKSDVLADVDRPVDDLMRGMIHGIAEKMFDAPATSHESQCEFQGDPFCRIVVTTEDDA